MDIKFFLLLLCLSGYTQISFSQKSPKIDRIDSTYILNGNIYAIYSTGKEKQITYSGLDSNPFIISQGSKIIFIRKVLGPFNSNWFKICKVDAFSLIESVVADKKPFAAFDSSYEILSIRNPTMSLDHQSLYFITNKWVTSDELVKINLNSGKWTELFSAESFELITKGPYKNLFLIGRSEIQNKGRNIYYKLMDEKGNVLKEFGDKESFNQFKKQVL